MVEVDSAESPALSLQGIQHHSCQAKKEQLIAVPNAVFPA